MRKIIPIYPLALFLLLCAFTFPKPPVISGKWKSETPENNGNGTFGIRKFIITKNKWEVIFTLYLDKEATKPVFTFRGSGSYSLQTPSEKVSGATNAVFAFSHKYLTLQTTQTELAKNFGLADLEPGNEKEVTENGLSFIESKSVCAQEFDLVSIINGKLYLGARPAQGKNICSEANRPTSLGLPLVKAD